MQAVLKGLVSQQNPGSNVRWPAWRVAAMPNPAVLGRYDDVLWGGAPQLERLIRGLCRPRLRPGSWRSPWKVIDGAEPQPKIPLPRHSGDLQHVFAGEYCFEVPRPNGRARCARLVKFVAMCQLRNQCPGFRATGHTNLGMGKRV
jgi:hypothetical protein